MEASDPRSPSFLVSEAKLQILQDRLTDMSEALNDEEEGAGEGAYIRYDLLNV
jgi:hypothetical protein